MLGQVAQAIKEFAERFDDNRAWLQYSRLTNTRVKGLDSPNLIHRYVKETLTGIISLLESGVTEADLDDLLERTDDLMRNLFPLIFVKADATKRLQDLKKRLSSNLESDLFDADEIQKIDSSYKAAQESKKKTEERIKEELQTMPRLRMSTIGSSHQLFASSKSGDDDQEALPLDRLKNLALCDDNSVDSQDAIVIFDESGCIPSYELLGLSRLGCGIAAILAVGDKQQLPPYSPATPNNRTKRGVQVPEETKLRSILDVSELKDKKALRKQYRVPRDIADILNARVYRGNYSTPPRAPVVGRGLKFRHVDFSESHRKKYVNPSEVDEVLHILNTSSAHSFETIMVLTPVSNIHNFGHCWLQ